MLLLVSRTVAGLYQRTDVTTMCVEQAAGALLPIPPLRSHLFETCNNPQLPVPWCSCYNYCCIQSQSDPGYVQSVFSRLHSAQEVGYVLFACDYCSNCSTVGMWYGMGDVGNPGGINTANLPIASIAAEGTHLGSLLSEGGQPLRCQRIHCYNLYRR